jgi:hypothetical protein
VISVIVASGLPANVACRILGVSAAGYYAWLVRPPSQRSIRHAWLTDVITQVHADSRETYGALRVHAELTLGHGITVGHNAVAMLMQRAGLQGLSGKPKWRRGVHIATALDLVDRQFTSTAPDRCGSPTSPSTRPAKARSTARWCSTCSRVSWSAGPSIRRRLPRWSPTRWAWPSTPALRVRAP